MSSADCRSAVFDCGGSIPSLPTINLPSGGVRAHIAQLAEHFLGKEEVLGSSPNVGSTSAASPGQRGIGTSSSMAKKKFERTKPHVNIGTIGHIDHGKT